MNRRRSRRRCGRSATPDSRLTCRYRDRLTKIRSRRVRTTVANRESRHADLSRHRQTDQRALGEQKTVPDGVNWIDAFSPTPDEAAFLREALKFEPPSLERMSEIESSSRLFRSRDAAVVTLPLPSHAGALGNTPLAGGDAFRACDDALRAAEGGRAAD